MLLHLVLGDTFREVMSVSPMDDGLILGWDWISSHDLHYLHDAGRVCLRSGPAPLQLDLLPAGVRPITPTLGDDPGQWSPGVPLAAPAGRAGDPVGDGPAATTDAVSTAGGYPPRLDGVVIPAARGPRRARARRGRSTSGGPRSQSPGPTTGTGPRGVGRFADGVEVLKDGTGLHLAPFCPADAELRREGADDPAFAALKARCADVLGGLRRAVRSSGTGCPSQPGLQGACRAPSAGLLLAADARREPGADLRPLLPE